MLARSLLGLAVGCAFALTACSEDTSTLTDGSGSANQGAQGENPTPNAPGAPSSGGQTTSVGGNPISVGAGPVGNVATNSPAGKDFYKTTVHPILASTCGSCHDTAGPGPNWLTPADAEKSYLQLYSQGYVVQGSRLTVKGTHDGSTTNALNATQIAAFNQWVTMEGSATGGAKATPQVLQKLGLCFDQTKFDAMTMGAWKTTPRNNGNNLNKVDPWNENQDNCTGCRNSPCSVCHSADAATNFNNAEGNPLLPKGTTFTNTKLTQPAYITKFFGVSPDGKAMASDGVKKKSVATKLSKAYSHPMFELTPDQQAAVDAFVLDSVTRFNAGSCGQ